jgi:hypothetical protein
MDGQTTVQKRKRADTTEDTISMQGLDESLNSDDYRYGLPTLLKRIIQMILMWTSPITNHFINQLFSGPLSIFYPPIKRIN